MNNDYEIYCGDTIAGLKTRPDNSVHCCVTSPPYYGLRNYGMDGQYGLEPSPEEYVARMVNVFHEVKRVLRDDGTLWLNIGDSYAGSGKGPAGKIKNRAYGPNGMTSHSGLVPRGMKAGDLMGIPWMLAFALRNDGWYLRSDVIWQKNSCLPESVKNRPTKSHEYVFLLTKQRHYYYDYLAIAEPMVSAAHSPGQSKIDASRNDHDRNDRVWGTNGKRNKRSVWSINPQSFSGSHFAVMPEKLAEPGILAGTSAYGCCTTCGASYARVIEDGERLTDEVYNGTAQKDYSAAGVQDASAVKARIMASAVEKVTAGWKPTCTCADQTPVPCIVLDPFTGSGTTGVVAIRHRRKFFGTELNPEYVTIAEGRLNNAILEKQVTLFP